MRRLDVVLALGNSDRGTAARAADLWHATGAGVVMCVGGHGRLTGRWERTEAAVLASDMVERGVDPDRVLLEVRSSNTLQNAQYAAPILAAAVAPPRVIALVTRPHLRLRALLTFQRHYPDDVIVVDPANTPAQTPDEFPELEAVRDQVWSEVPRIATYSARGDIASPVLPDHVRQSWSYVVEHGEAKRGSALGLR